MADPTETGVDPYPEGISNVKTDPTTGQVTHFTQEPAKLTTGREFLDALYLKHSEPETGIGELPAQVVVPVKWPDWDTARFEINTHKFREEYKRKANEFRNRRDPDDRATSLEVPKPENVFTLPDEHPDAPAHSDMVQYRRIAFEAYENSKIPLVLGNKSNAHRQPMSKDVWLEDLKKKKDRGIWQKAGAFSAAAGVGAKDFIKNGFIALTDTVFLGFMEEGYWKSLGEGSAQGMVGFGQMLDSALYHSAVPGTGNIFLDTEDPDAVDKAYQHYRDKHYNANVMQDGLAFTPEETQYWSNFNQYNRHGAGKWTDESGKVIHGPMTTITSQVVDPTLLAFVPVGVLAKPLARAGAKGFMWTVSKGAGATRVAAETGAKLFSKPRTMVDNIMSKVVGQPGAGGAVMGATTKIEAGFAVAANYAGRVEDVTRVMSTKSGQRRFLQRLILDPKIRGTKTQTLALIAYQASGTQMADKVFNILIDTASAGGVSAAFAFASGGSVEEAGYSWGASGVMGGTSGAAFGPAGFGKTTDVTQGGKLSGRTKEDVKNIQPRLQQVGEATYESISPGQATTDAQIARNERALAQWKEKLTQGLPEEQKARLDEMNSGELHEFFKKKFGEQARDQFNALPPEVQGMYTTMTAVHGDVMPKFFVFDSKAELARFYDSLFNEGDGTITEKNGPEGVYDKNLGMVLLHKGQGGRSSSAVVLRAFTHEMAHATIGVQIDKMLDGSDGYGPERILWEGLIKEIGPQKAGEATVDFQIHDGRGAVKVDENGNPQTVKVGKRGQEFAKEYNAATGGDMGTNATKLAHEMLAESTALMFMEDSNAFNHMTHAGTLNMETVMRGTLGRLGLVDRYGKIIHIRRSEAFRHGNNMSKTLFAFANNPKVKTLLANYTKVQELNQLKAAKWDNDGVVEQPAPGMTAGATFASRHTGVTQVTGEMRGILSDASRGDAAKTHSRFAPVSEIGASDVVNVKTEYGTVEATVGEVGGTTSRKKITTLEQPASLALSSVESGDTITVIRDGNSIYTKSPVENRGSELTDSTGAPFEITDGDTVVIHGPDGTLKSMVENATKTDSSIDGVFKARTEIPTRQVTKSKAGHSSTIASEGPGGQGQRLSPEFYSHLEAKGPGGRAVVRVLRQIEAGIANNGTLHFAYSKRSSRKGNNAFMEREVIPTEFYISKGHARPSVRGWDLPSIFSNIDQLVEHGVVKDGDALKQKMVDKTQEIRERTRGIDPNDPSVNLLEAFEIGDPLIAAVMGARIENVSAKNTKLGNLLEQLNELGLWKHLGGRGETSTYRGYNIDTMQALRVNYGDVINFRQQNVSEAHLPGDRSVQHLPGFHSQVEQVVQSNKIPNRASPQQILATLRKQPGVKEQELKWMDLEGFMEGKKSVSKEELLEYINLNKLEVEVVELDPAVPEDLPGHPRHETPELTTPGYKPGTYRELLFRVPEPVGHKPGTLRPGTTKADVLKAIEESMEGRWTEHPDDQAWMLDSIMQSSDVRKTLHELFPEAEWQQMAQRLVHHEGGDESSLPYDEGHYGTIASNVFAHTRVAEFEVDGKRVLHATEMQSDWHKDYRKDKKLLGTNLLHETVTVPKPPYEGTWHQFTLKALVDYAVKNGFDEVAWITGEQTKARYDLSKKVDSVDVYRTGSDDGIVTQVIALKDGERVAGSYFNEDGVSIAGEHFGGATQHVGRRIWDIYPKEVADRIMRSKRNHFTMRDTDLEAGGEWADNLYDKALPKTAQKLGKKFGTKVRKGELIRGKGDVQWEEVLSQDHSSGKMGFYNISVIENGKVTLDRSEISLKGVESLLGPELAQHIKDGKGKYSHGHEGRGGFVREIRDANVRAGESWPGAAKPTDAWFLEITPEMKKSVMEEGQQQWLPGPIENAKQEFQQAGRVVVREEDAFFGGIWPKMLRKVGGQVKPGSRGYQIAAKRAIGDIEDWLIDNPKYADYYNKDWQVTKGFLDDHYGRTLSDDEFAFYRVAAGLTSPSTKLPSNIGDSVKVLDLWMREGDLDSIEMGVSAKGNVVIKNSPISISGATNSTKARTLKIVDGLAKEKGGVVKALDFLQESVTIKELNEFNTQMGYKGRVGGIGPIRELVKQATGQDELIPRMFIFGKKVGAYTLNAIGDARYNTVDVWESRFIRSYFKGMFDENTGLPENVGESTIFNEFSIQFKREYEKETGQEWDTSALQAIRWFYMIDAAKQGGYSGASTNETISTYTERNLAKIRGANPESRRPGTGKGSKEIRTQTPQEVTQQLPAPAMRPSWSTGDLPSKRVKPPVPYRDLVTPGTGRKHRGPDNRQTPGSIYSPSMGEEDLYNRLLRN